ADRDQVASGAPASEPGQFLEPLAIPLPPSAVGFEDEHLLGLERAAVPAVDQEDRSFRHVGNLTLADARRIIEAWRQDYNTARPHSALGYLTPEEFERLISNGEGGKQEAAPEGGSRA